MAGREYHFMATLRAWVRGIRQAGRPAAVAALSLALLGVGGLWLRRAEAEASQAQAADAVVETGVVVGEFEGYFDGATRKMTIQPRRGAGSRTGRGGVTPQSRIYPGVEINPGSGYNFQVVASKFQGTGDYAGTVSGEVSIAMGSGCDLSRLGAGAVLLRDDLSLLPRAVAGARRL